MGPVQSSANLPSGDNRELSSTAGKTLHHPCDAEPARLCAVPGSPKLAFAHQKRLGVRDFDKAIRLRFRSDHHPQNVPAIAALHQALVDALVWIPRLVREAGTGQIGHQLPLLLGALQCAPGALVDLGDGRGLRNAVGVGHLGEPLQPAGFLWRHVEAHLGDLLDPLGPGRHVPCVLNHIKELVKFRQPVEREGRQPPLPYLIRQPGVALLMRRQAHILGEDAGGGDHIDSGGAAGILSFIVGETGLKIRGQDDKSSGGKRLVPAAVQASGRDFRASLFTEWLEKGHGDAPVGDLGHEDEPGSLGGGKERRAPFHTGVGALHAIVLRILVSGGVVGV